MATTSTAEQPLNMIERKEPTLIKFADGESISGLLVGIERIEVDKKPIVRYTVQDLDSGELSSFLGTYQINAKIRRNDVGHVIDVRYEGEDKSVSRNGNNMRKFKVLVSDRHVGPLPPGTAADGTLITDEDIGF